jgi:uncharacterized protein (TIGR03437 family)
VAFPSSRVACFSRLLFCFLCIGLQLEAPGTKAAPGTLKPADSPTQRKITEASGKRRLSFELNRGQADPSVKFLARGDGFGLFLRRDGARLRLNGSKASSETLSMKLLGANSSPSMEGVEPLQGKSNYLLGKDRSAWITGVEHFARVRYREVYRGVDLVFYGNQEQLEYDFIIAPGVDPRVIRLRFDGAKSVRIDAKGDLAIRTASGELRQPKPVVYQMVDGDRRGLDGRYIKLGSGSIGFRATGYDRKLPLVIDPLLSYRADLGGNLLETARGLIVDAEGSAYIAGSTTSSNFPVTPGAARSANIGRCSDSGGQPLYCTDGFVTKLSPEGNAIIYSTYFGGSGFDEIYALAVDPAGAAYITGKTESNDLPIVGGVQRAHSARPLIQSLDGGSSWTPSGVGLPFSEVSVIAIDPITPTTLYAGVPLNFNKGEAFVAKLNATGTALDYSTYLGGSGDESGAGIAVDAAGNAYVAGFTNSADFPAVSALQPTIKGKTDVFLAKVNPTGSAFLFSTYLGGSEIESVADIALDSVGAIYLTGNASSPDFPTTSGVFQSTGPGGDGFVAKIDNDGSKLIYSTLLGGTARNRPGALTYPYSLDVDANGAIVVGGLTTARDFPTTPGALQSTPVPSDCRNEDGRPRDCSDAFVTKLNAAGSGLIYSTLISTSLSDRITAVKLDKNGEAYISVETGLPFFSGPTLSTKTFLAKLNANASAYTEYLETTSIGLFSRLAVDGAGNIYGATGGDLRTDNNMDVFDVSVVRIVPGTSSIGATVSAATYRPSPFAMGSLAIIYGANLSSTTIAASSVPLPTTLGGATIKIKDSTGVERFAPLLYVSPNQINYMIPEETAPGLSNVTVSGSAGQTGSYLVRIQPLAPGVFSANSNGIGAPAAVVLRVNAAGLQTFEPVARFDSTQGRFVPEPIDFGQETDRLYLILFGTGWRFHDPGTSAIAYIGGIETPITYIGAQSSFAGLDQINLQLPRSLAGWPRGDITMNLNGILVRGTEVGFK